MGSELVPGTYTSAGPSDGNTCYWKRSRDGKIVDNAMTKKPQVVRIEPTDTEFRTSGCKPWQRNDAAQVPPGADPIVAQWKLRGYLAQLNLGSAAIGGGQVSGP